MAAISSFNGLFFRVAFLLGLTFCCFKNVNLILQNSYMAVFTQAMHLPALSMSQNSAQLGLFGLLFLFSAISDLIPLLEGNEKFFGSVVPFRLFMFFTLTALAYMWESNLYLHNNAVFTYCFVEVWINFIILGALREERNEQFKNSNQFSAQAVIVEEVKDNDENSDSDVILTSAQEIEQVVDVMDE